MLFDNHEDKVPPYAEEAEKALVGSLLSGGSEVLARVTDRVTAGHLYLPEHRLVWQAAHAVDGAGIPVDLVTVVNYLREHAQLDKAGGAGYLALLMEQAPVTANAEVYADAVVSAAVGRAVAAEGQQMAAAAYAQQEPSEAILAEAMGRLERLMQNGPRTDHAVHLASAMRDYVTGLEERRKRQISGVATGLTAIDDATGGLQPSDLIILAGRPGQGKTSLGLTIAHNAAVRGHSVLVYSLEMTRPQICARLVSLHRQIDVHKQVQARVNDSEMAAIAEAEYDLGELAIAIDDTAGISIDDIVGRTRRYARDHRVDLVVIDYYQLITANAGRSGNRDQELGLVSRGLKGLAKRLNVPILLLAQVNRNIENRADRRPNLADLRESGNAEQDSDIVIFLSRPETWGQMTAEDGSSNREVAELAIAKHRNGRTGTFISRFIGEYARFCNWSDPDPTPPTNGKRAAAYDPEPEPEPQQTALPITTSVGDDDW